MEKHSLFLPPPPANRVISTQARSLIRLRTELALEGALNPSGVYSRQSPDPPTWRSLLRSLISHPYNPLPPYCFASCFLLPPYALPICGPLQFIMKRNNNDGVSNGNAIKPALAVDHPQQMEATFGTLHTSAPLVLTAAFSMRWVKQELRVGDHLSVVTQPVSGLWGLNSVSSDSQAYAFYLGYTDSLLGTIL